MKSIFALSAIAALVMASSAYATAPSPATAPFESSVVIAGFETTVAPAQLAELPLGGLLLQPEGDSGAKYPVGWNKSASARKGVEGILLGPQLADGSGRLDKRPIFKGGVKII